MRTPKNRATGLSQLFSYDTVEFIRSRVTITKLHEPKLRVRVSTRTIVLVAYIRSSSLLTCHSSSILDGNLPSCHPGRFSHQAPFSLTYTLAR